MWGTELRGLLAVALVVAAIAVAWTRIENRSTTEVTASTTTSTTTTTTTLPTTTTMSVDEANALICARAEAFLAEVELLESDGPGPLAELALPFWTDIATLATGPAATEIVPVVTFYEDYIETAQPFGYDSAKIIVEGDKEKFEFLVTRPTNGLDDWRGLIAFGCGLEIPDKPRMSARAFNDLEDRLLDDDDDR